MDRALVGLLRPMMLRLGHHSPVIHCVVTHSTVDVDAIACTTLGEMYMLLDGQSKLSPHSVPSGTVVLDHPQYPETKGEYSAFSEWAPPETNPSLIKEVDEADGKGPFDGPGRFELQELLCGEEGFSLEKAYHRGVEAIKRDKQEFQGFLSQVVIHDINGYHFVEIPPETGIGGPDFAIWLQKQDPLLVGSVCRTRYGIGILRYPKATKPDLSVLRDHLPGWYFDRRGFLVAWGTRKAPKSEPPPHGTPRSVENLIQLMKEVIPRK